MRKKSTIWIVVVFLVLTIAFMGRMRYQKMAENIEKAYQEITIPDLSEKPDGVYSGSFSDFILRVDVKVTLKDQQIIEVETERLRAGWGYEARETPQIIIKAQSPLVDAVSGATGTSKCFMIAVHKALR